jgi:hypothetical protein
MRYFRCGNLAHSSDTNLKNSVNKVSTRSEIVSQEPVDVIKFVTHEITHTLLSALAEDRLVLKASILVQGITSAVSIRERP